MSNLHRKFNKHGVETSYFLGRFNKMRMNMSDYKPEELVRDLEKMIAVAKGEAEADKRADFNGKGTGVVIKEAG